MRSSQRVVVGCRVRPLLSPDDNGKEICVFPHIEKQQQKQNGATTTREKSPFSTDSNKNNNMMNQDQQQQQEPSEDFYSSLIFNNKKKFTFDQVFFPDDSAPPTSASSPVGIFSSMVLPLIDAATLDSYNSSLLLYGQTGAGKSHTLSQLVHPVVSTLIDRVGCENLMFRMIEIQNDNLRDLLASPSQQQQQDGKNNNSNNKLQLRDAGNNNNNNQNTDSAAAPTTTYGSGVQLTGATLAVIETEDDALWLFQEAFRRRATAPTGMNASSSRSHAIFSIFITFPDGRVTKIDLVDLAGSERQKKTQNSGKRMKESVGINSDLLALGNVLRAVAGNQSHIGYRQCKLTRLLQDSIGGRSITTFLACVSPLTFNKDESLRTLQYSAVASSIVNTPVQVVAPPPPPPPPAAPVPTQQQEETNHLSPPSVSSLNQQQKDPSKSSPEQQQSCQQCKVLAAALDRSETHAFNLENQIAEMNETLEHAQSDLKKDERIFVMKFKEARELSKENEMLKKRIAELEQALMMKPTNGKITTTTTIDQTKQQQQQQEKKEQQQQQQPPTSSRFASTRVRGPCFSYEFDDNNDNEEEEEQEKNNKLLPSEDREEPVPLSQRSTTTMVLQPEVFIIPKKMNEESRKLVVRASLDSSAFNNNSSNHQQKGMSEGTSPFSFQQALIKHKMKEMMMMHQEQEQEEGPVYSLSPSPREREEQEDDEQNRNNNNNFSRTFVSTSTAGMLGGSRHLNFDTTSMMYQHQ